MEKIARGIEFIPAGETVAYRAWALDAFGGCLGRRVGGSETRYFSADEIQEARAVPRQLEMKLGRG